MSARARTGALCRHASSPRTLSARAAPASISDDEMLCGPRTRRSPIVDAASCPEIRPLFHFAARRDPFHLAACCHPTRRAAFGAAADVHGKRLRYTARRRPRAAAAVPALACAARLQRSARRPSVCMAACARVVFGRRSREKSTRSERGLQGKRWPKIDANHDSSTYAACFFFAPCSSSPSSSSRANCRAPVHPHGAYRNLLC